MIVRSTAPLELRARALLRAHGCQEASEKVRVRWNPRMRSTAGTAYPLKTLICINPKLIPFGDEEIERTFLHELAHLLAHARAGRRRIAPHGAEWQKACRDLGMADETRCHTLPLPRRKVVRRHLYRCPACGKLVPRVKPIRHKVACLACCRAHSRGQYDERFCLVKVRPAA